MNWAAVWVIGAICAVVGVLLYVPAYWWAKRKVGLLPPDSPARLRVTSAGLAFCVLVLGLTLAGISRLHFEPESEFARFLRSGIGMAIFLAALAIVGGLIGMVLEFFGFALYRPPDDERK